jgi:metal-responsive CopG/Arc/MetJ family transcriptional regulator
VAVYKVNVSLPPDLVAEIDAVAAERGLSRSGFIAEASAHYLADQKALSVEEQRKRDIDRAMADIRERGKKIPRDYDYVAAIREDRERRRIW